MGKTSWWHEADHIRRLQQVHADHIESIYHNLAELDYRPAILMISHDPRVMGLASEIYGLEQGLLTSLRDNKPAIATAG